MKKIICWFRNDLRLKDNPAFSYSTVNGLVAPIFIFDQQIGEASKWWLHNALLSLDGSLKGALQIFNGDSVKIITNLVKENKIHEVVFNACYEPHASLQEQEIKKNLDDMGVNLKIFHGNLLFEPGSIVKDDQSSYRVFTPFYKKFLNLEHMISEPVGSYKNLQALVLKHKSPKKLHELKLMPKIKWYEQFSSMWDVSEDGAHNNLKRFMKEGIVGYEENRNYPSKKNVSRLSPYLRFGQISPHRLYYEAKKQKSSDGNFFIRELLWREFYHNLLLVEPQMPTKNWQDKYDNFPWINDSRSLKLWQKGMTGYPLVDAGMRELWQTGYMHNRVRMIVASFLVKNLLIHWHKGQDWFWSCLLDADLANNSGNWQWVAGCGVDAAPYFRIFNPTAQGEKFDQTGEYTKKYVPELKDLPDKYLFKPFLAPKEILQKAGVILGKTYPYPIVDLKYSRERALAEYHKLK